MTKDLAHNINRYQYIILFVCVGVMYSGKYDVSDVTMSRGGKNRRALLAGNVKQLQEIHLNEDLLLKILKKTLTPMYHYGRNNIWLTDIIS
jgi:hypothetical protein